MPRQFAEGLPVLVERRALLGIQELPDRSDVCCAARGAPHLAELAAKPLGFRHPSGLLGSREISLQLAAAPASLIELLGVFGVERDGRIARFLGRGRDAGLPEYMFGSVQVLSPAILERMPPGPFASMGDLYPRLFDEGKRFYGYVYEGPWYTADTVEDLQATRKALGQSGPPAHMARIPPP